MDNSKKWHTDASERNRQNVCVQGRQRDRVSERERESAANNRLVRRQNAVICIMAKNCAQRKRTGRARNAPKNDGLLNVVNLLPRPPTPGKESQLGPRHIQISSGKCTQKRRE